MSTDVTGNARLRVALDLSGPSEPLGDWVELLADALEKYDLSDVVRCRTGHEPQQDNDAHLRGRALWRPLWRRSRGRALARLLPSVDVVHVAGLATPPQDATPLVISIDDLRPFRGGTRDRQRSAQLRRAVRRGAQLVASSLTASAELQRSLDLPRERVSFLSPPVAWDEAVLNGTDLVVNLTGRIDEFLPLAPPLMALAQQRDARVVVLASKEAATRLRPLGRELSVHPRRDAATVLRRARTVVHLSDGARFPSFAVAALAAGVPTCATATAVNRELLDGAVSLADDRDPATLLSTVTALWENEALRSVRIAAGRVRASDYAPDVAARAYVALYHHVVQRNER